MPLVCAAAGAADSHAHALADLDATDLGDVAPHEHADKGADMDPEPNADRATVVYRDPDGNRIVFSHGYLHFDTENYRDLDLDADDDAHRDADLHQSADVPDRDELEREGAKV